MSSENKYINKYKPELDGIRALAIVSASFYNFNKESLPSGYLGIDIFAVVSGYVITSSLANKEYSSFFDFITSFYKRRIKRLLPALLVMVVIISVLTSLVDPEPVEDLKTGFLSLFGISNLYLWRSASNYFSYAAELNPFTHTWSLGVEEQFYILFPFLLWFSGFLKNKKKYFIKLFFISCSISIISIVIFIYFSLVSKSTAYYLLPSRLWELLMGCNVFLMQNLFFKKDNNVLKINPWIPLFIILISLYLPLNLSILATILVTFNTALLIVNIEQNKILYSLFTNKFMNYIGKLSYSIYLWRWSLIAISLWTIGVFWWTIPFQVFMIIIFAILSYELIEKPLRYRDWKNKIKISFFYLSILFILNNISSYAQKLFIGETIPSSLKRNLIGIKSNSICDIRSPILFKGEETINSCTFALNPVDRNQKKIYYLGSSSAGTLTGLANKTLKKTNTNQTFLYVGASIFPKLNKKYYPYELRKNLSSKNNNHQKSIEDYLSKNIKNKDLVIIFNHLNKVFQEKKNQTHKERELFREGINAWLTNLENFVNKMDKKGVNVIIFKPHPLFTDFKKSKSINTLTCFRSNIKLYINKSCYAEFERAKQRESLKLISHKLDLLALKNHNLFVFDPFPILCKDEKICKNIVNNKITYFDESHLNNYGGELLYDDFYKLLKNIKFI